MEVNNVETVSGKVEEPLDDIDFDIDFAVNEPGRTMVLGKYENVDDVEFDDMQFAIANGDKSLSNHSSGTVMRSRPGLNASINPSNIQHDSREKSKYTRSDTRAIPISTTFIPHQQLTMGATSQASSAGSTGSAFLNNILNPASTFNNAHLSHTPPTQVSTSYEVSHFGKRARSGSISERLRVSSELEQKGMIDIEQKGILKDLIISGQDNELQHALDMYEQGDVKVLERMVQSGTLSNRAMTDIDLLGDLDLDFLNVSDGQDGNAAVAGHYTDATNNAIHPPPSLSTREHMQQLTVARETPQTNVLGEATDGIGELDFDGGIDGSDGFASMQSYDRAPSPVYHSYGQRSRSNSTFSIDGDIRQRSNSLFSALIGTAPHEAAAAPSDYGRWMEKSSNEGFVIEGSRFRKTTRRASAPNLQRVPSTIPSSNQNNKRGNKTKTAVTKREIRAEEKRRERQQKKEKKERDKQEKREKRELAKMEKQKKAEMEEKEEHQPGSGRPRSMSDPNLRSSVDVNGLLNVERPDGWIGAYSPESRKIRIARFLEKRNHRVWTKTVKYDVRKNFADSRLRVKGRFVKKEDELLMRELMSLT